MNCKEIPLLSFQLFKSLHVQLEMRRKQVEGALHSTQKDGILTVDQALVKQAWERVSNTVSNTGEQVQSLRNLVYYW